MTFDVYDGERYFIGTFEPDLRVEKVLGGESCLAVAVRLVSQNRFPCVIVENESAMKYKFDDQTRSVWAGYVSIDGAFVPSGWIQQDRVMRSRREARPS